MDGKATLASNVNVKHHVSVNNLPQKKIKLKINDKINGEFVLDVLIDGSVIAGRNNECDVYFDDLNMSRQHFALETDGTGVYITDLESSNGTFVNGIRVNQRTELQSNDEIAAGNIHARIFW